MGETLTLLFRKHKEHAYEVQVKESWSGRTVIGNFTPPYTGKQIAALQKKLNSLKSDDKELRQIGQRLFAALCGNETSDVVHHEVSEQSVQAVLRSVIQRTLRRRGTVALTFCFEPECAEFVQYPWELLHNGDHSLLASGVFTLTRALLQPDSSAGGELPVRLPMRVLYIGSSPNDCETLETERSFHALYEAFTPLMESGQVHVDRLEPATFDDLVTYLNSYGGANMFNDSETDAPCYVVHFDGHGAYGRLCTENGCEKLNDPSALKCADCGATLNRIKPQTYLSFCTETGCTQYIDTQALRELFLSSDVRLVVLSACETATVTTSQLNKQRVTAVDATLATALVMAQVPAVVAMPFSLQDDITPIFMSHFYEALASGRTLEEALSRARQSLLATHQRSWFVPVLYRHVVEGKIGPVALLINDNEDTLEEHDHPLEHLDIPASYVGREQELRDLSEMLSLATQSTHAPTTKTPTGRLRAGMHHIALTGSPGIGKSALAGEAVRRNREKFPGGIVGISLQGGKSFSDALIEILHFLHVPVKGAPDLAYRARLVLNTLRAKASRELPCLLLLDRFDEVKDASELEQWLHFLCAFPQEVVVMVTSRSNPGAMLVVDGTNCRWYEYHVGKMRDEDLLKLFLELASANGLDQYIHLEDPDQQAILQEICTLLDGYPLGAELIFGATHSINGRTFAPEAATRSLAEIRNELRNNPLAGILAVLDVSYRRLSLIARLLLAYLSTFKLPFSSEQIVMLVASETSTSTGDAIRLIRQQDIYQEAATTEEEKIFPAELANNWQAARVELVQASFMQFDGRVYTIHPQVRNFAISHLSMEERRRVHRLVAKYYSTLPQPSPEEWLAAVEHLESAGEAQDLREAVQVAVRATWALGGRGHAQELLTMLRRASVHASRFGDKLGEGQIQCCLGAILRQLGQFAEAEACLRSSLDFYKEQQTRAEEGWSLYELAMLFREEGNFQQANIYALEAQTLFRELGDAKGEAWMETVLSEIRRGTGAYYDAFGHVNRALISFTSMHNKEGIASALRDRGTIYEAMGKYAEASDDYSEALHIFNELGLRSSQAWVLTDKSIISAHLGKLDEAEKICLEAIAIFREQGMRRGEAWALRALGDIKHYLHDYEQARAYFMKSEALLTALGCRVDLARVLVSLGAIEFHENDSIAAQEQYEQAYTLAHEQGAKQLEGHALRGLGDVARVLHYYDEAEHRYATALTIATDLDTPAEECAVVYRLGLLHEAQGHFPLALDHFVHALALDVRLGHPSLSNLQAHIECMVKEHQLEEAYTTFCKQHNLGC